MPVDTVLGLQRGDEGKGRITDLLSADYDAVERYNGGPNAGHTLSHNGRKLALHQIPSGIRNPDTLNIIGNGALVDLVRLEEEVESVREVGIEVSPDNFYISDAAHLILPHHVMLDEIREAGKGAQDTTVRGIAFAASDKYQRSGIRVETLSDEDALNRHIIDHQLSQVDLDWLNKYRQSKGKEPYDIDAEREKVLASARIFYPYVADTISLLHNLLDAGKNVLAEGAQASSLDIEQAPYPFGSSSHTTTGGALVGMSIGPREFREVYGVVKAVKSHVGGGPFVTEIKDETLADRIRGPRGLIDSEYGASTGRTRRIGYLDLPELRRAIQVNGVTQLALNKLDVLPKYGASLKVATAYDLGGKEIDRSPSSLKDLEQCRPIYTDLPLWNEDISGARRMNELPKKAHHLLDFLKDQLGVEVTFVGVGPHPDQVIRR